MALAVVRRIISGPNQGTVSHASATYNEKASQTFKGGAALIASSGYLVEDTTTDGTSTNKVAAIAEEDGHNASADDAKIHRVLQVGGGQVFEGTLATSSGGSGNAPLAVALAQTDLWASYNLAKQTSSGLWYIDQADGGGSNVRVLIVGFRDAVGTSNARVYFKVLNSKQVNA